VAVFGREAPKKIDVSARSADFFAGFTMTSAKFHQKS
jgi:hypothetical protein